MIVLGVDPGTDSSGVVIFGNDPMAVYSADHLDNQALLYWLRSGVEELQIYVNGKPQLMYLAVENIESFGLAVGKTTFKTCIWIGRFIEAWENKRNEPAHLISRGDERIVICGAATYMHPETKKRHRVSDAEIRKALIEQFPATGEGKTPQIGTKKKPGPLYKVKGHAWSALSVAYTFAQTHDERGNLKGERKDG